MARYLYLIWRNINWNFDGYVTMFYLRNCHSPDNPLGVLIFEEVGTIWQMSFLLIDIRLTGLQGPECVVGTRRVAG